MMEQSGRRRHHFLPDVNALVHRHRSMCVPPCCCLGTTDAAGVEVLLRVIFRCWMLDSSAPMIVCENEEVKVNGKQV